MAAATVREATADDALDVAHVWIASWRAAYGDLLPARVFDEFDPQRRAQQIRDRMASGATLLVAPAHGTPLALLTFGASRDDDGGGDVVGDGGGDVGGDEIYAVYARAEAFGTGLGPALMAAAIARTARPLTLWVLADNPRARRFYDKSGFAPDGATRDITIGGVTLPELRYRLR